MNRIILPAILSMSLLVSACGQNDQPSYGFSLPEGDAENGQFVFTEMRCIECHILAGTEFVSEKPSTTSQGDIIVEIGGEAIGKVQTYDDLVTSIINPSHRIAAGYTPNEVTINGESRMTNYNDIMTVTELIDLVTFLKSEYELKSVPLTVYPYYAP